MSNTFGLSITVARIGYQRDGIRPDECGNLAVGGFQCECGYWIYFSANFESADTRPAWTNGLHWITHQQWGCIHCGAVYDVQPD